VAEERVVTLGLDTPAALVALAALPLFLVGARRAPAAAACRALGATALVLALAGLYRERDRPAVGVCLVAAVDRSASVGDAAAARARDFLARTLPALGPADLAGAVAFGARARVVAAPAPGPTVATLLPTGPGADVGAEDTDLATAVATAASLCPAGRQASVLLVTDGNETLGSVLAQAAALEPRVPVFPLVPAPATLAPAAVRRLNVPALAPAGGVVPAEVVVESREAVSAVLVLDSDGGSGPPRPVDLVPGLNVVPAPFRARGRGARLLEARLLLPPGAPEPPPAAPATLTVTGPLRVLVASARPAPPVLADALARHRIDVEVTSPAGLAARRGTLAHWHAVVLDDLGSAALAPPTLAALRAWVAAGGALVVTGGPHAFGDAGLAGSALERTLPVTLSSQTPEPRRREPIALYLVIDRSNSMGDVGADGVSKLDYARRAALAVLDELAPADLVGAVAFDAEAHELGGLAAAGKTRAALAGRIARLRHGGGTDFLDALALAGRRLAAAPPRVRHVVLLTDGDTNRHPEDHDWLIAALVRDGVSVTAIRIGTDTANLALLATIAGTTGGEFHHVTSLAALPQLMIHDARRRMDESAGRQPGRARLGVAGPLLAGLAEDELPPVARWAVTRPKPGAEVRLWVDGAEGRDPLLVTWRYGLGHAAVLPVDFQSGAAAWAAWRGFGKLWTQLVRWAAPVALPADRRLVARRTPEGVWVTLETATALAEPPVLRLPAAGDVVLQPVGPRRFAALVPALAAGRHRVRLLVGAGPAERVVLAVPARAASGREGRAVGAASALLARLAAVTGGRVDPAPADVLAARPGSSRDRQPLATPLALVALLLVLADVALREPGRSRAARPAQAA
jgi:Ca-activated chloride channel homolog